MNPGRLNTLIIIETRTLAVDAYQQRVETWATDATTRAALLDTPSGNELPAAAGRQEHASDLRRYQIRRRSDLTKADHRLKIGDDYFDILHIADPDGRDINSRKFQLLLVARIETAITEAVEIDLIILTDPGDTITLTDPGDPITLLN